MDDIDLNWPALLQLRQLKDFKTWACRPYRPGRKQIPLFWTPEFDRQHPWSFPLAFLESCTQGHVLQIFLFWFPALMIAGYWTVQNLGPLQWFPSLIGLGSWTWVEYWVHRSLFHNWFSFNYVPELVFMVHFVHHKQPKDTWRLTMPLIMSLPMGAAILASMQYFLSLTGLWSTHPWLTTLSWGLGFGVGYVIYDLLHFAAHFCPVRTSLQRHHLAHHGLCHRKFGFTTSWWDKAFNTD